MLVELPGFTLWRLPAYSLLICLLLLQRNCLGRAVCAEIAAYVLVVDEKDGIAACFYSHHGFITLPSNPLKLFLPFATARSVIV
ncbi:hypothetical protein [Robbsia betulipollinis]|uniref:hypothetical protein n=1 Tax=Robbsia betulipollinis TaxID=2981849 RepID=UPI0032C471D9